MKKLFLILIPVLFISCGTYYRSDYRDYEFHNESSITVSFKWNSNNTIYTLPPETECIIKKIASDDVVEYIDNPRIDVKDDTHSGIVTIKDLQSHTAYVFNPLSQSVCLSEINGFLGDNYGDTVTIEPDTEVLIKLFTKNPQYRAIATINSKSIDVTDKLLFY